MKNILFLFMLVLLPAVLLLSACTTQDTPFLPMPSPDELIGGDTDAQGCLISAGYQWCPSTQECQRMWETYCPEYADSYKEPGMCTREYNPVCGLVAIQCVTTPCDPVPVTFSNPCMAEDAGVINYTFGMCPTDIDSFETCALAGYPVMESHPRQCMVGDTIFVEEIELSSDVALACEQAQGNWLAEFNECEWISEAVCSQLGGTFKECESACRNDPDAMVCTLQCVAVCDFN